ncbi:MAG: sugar ABC transporter permease [Eubacteriales bacterium]|nr:sugar ABC transporter permease [Eubacteriales bacterium]MDD3880868.1 sugar ABC transporter permease [Eubacteriales bacterium]MDD4511765.1 sugar ABC transporter permease [Eubacteriales bacterium]
MFRKKKVVWLLLLPAFTGLFVFYIIPFFGGIYYSLTDGTFQNNFIGFGNYAKVWNNTMFQTGLKNTLILSVLCAPAIWIISFILADMLRVLDKHAKGFRNILLLPYLMPSAALILIWTILFDYGGVVNKMLVALGLDRVIWLRGAPLRVPIIILYMWKNIGFSVVIFTAAFQSVPISLYEFASLEGASPLYQEFKITLPLISPSAFLVFVMAWINAFKIFKEAYYIGGAYPDSMEIYTLQHFMNNHFAKINYQYVTTAAYSFAIIVFVLFALLYYMESRIRKGVN